ncbi:MAG: arginase family protein [Acidobacteriota bacterium]
MRGLVVPFHVGDPVDGLETPAGCEAVRPALPPGTPQERMVVLFETLAARVAEDAIRLVYAGDCMAPLGVLAGLERRGLSPSIVWFDAHGDFNTWETTPSGYIGGMPMAMMVGLGEQSIVQGIGLGQIEPRRIVLAGARDIDTQEGAALATSGIQISSVEDAPDAVPDDGSSIHVHLDVDVVTPGEMPGLRFPAAGGPSLGAVERALRSLAASGRVACVTVACTWDPARGRAGEAVAATERLVAAILPTAGS